MLDAAREAFRFGAGRTPEDLLKDRVLTLALVRCIEIIGQAATKISAEMRAEHPEIPWADMIGMRNRLVHAYFDVDLGRVCDTLTADLPPLIDQLERLLSPQER
ncbi:MAG: HepT-like ribonuclease domain-containing protein [Bryobacteraceae bacterium]|jgi:uncharacterized protein with HEPN domain